MPPLPSPMHRVVVYYVTQHSNKYITPTPLIPFATHLVLGQFYLDDTNDVKKKTISLNNKSLGDSSLTKMWIDVARMQGSGIKVIGELFPTSLARLASNFSDYYKPLSSCITGRRLDGISVSALGKSDSYDTVVNLIQRLKADFGEKFIVTLSPAPISLKGESNYSGFDYRTLEKDYGTKIDWYNVQFCDEVGSLKTTTDYETIVAGCPLDPSRIVAVILTNENSGGGFVKLDSVKSIMRMLLKKYGNRFGGIAGWDYYNSEPDTDEPWTWTIVMKVAMANYKEVLAVEYMNST